ncbi:MAG: hypothetical protein P4L99_01425 [Chthoniobacter sp.]|nr:hypothetical protein [Chthoniobacter sp.]
MSNDGQTRKVDAKKNKEGQYHVQIAMKDSDNPQYKALVKLADGREFSSDDAALASLSKSTASPPTTTATGSASPPAPPVVHESIPPVPILMGKVDLTGTREIALPGAISEVVSAQDGRSLLLYMKETKQVAVFDVIDLKIRGFINVGVDDALIAGGSRYLLAASRSNNVIERFSLQTLQKDKAVTSPFGDFLSFTMGRSSPNIALIVAQPAGSSFPSITAFDADRMAALTELPNSRATLSENHAIVRASADGRTFGMMRPDVSPMGFIVLSYRDGALVQSFYQHDTYGLLVPNADGSQILSSQAGVYTNQGVPIIKAHWNWAEGVTYVPSYHPAFFLGVPYDEIPQRKKKVPPAIGVYSTGATQPLLQIPDGFKEMEPAARQPGRHFDPISVDQRYHFFPQLNLILTIPPTNDRIVARAFNLRQALDGKGVDYLYVTSSPPAGKVSTPYHYQLEAASHSGDVTFSLQSGPKDLSISKGGKVTWTPPSKPADETVIVSLKDKSGQELLHTFRVVTVK